MNRPLTYTHTWTQTRIETIQDQFRHLLQYGNIDEARIKRLLQGIADKGVEAVAIYGCDASGLRVIEVELRIDWSSHGKLVLEVPAIPGGLPGWLGKQSPEIRVAGRRFGEVAQKHALRVSFWVRLVPSIRNNAARKDKWRQRLKLGGSIPAWKGGGFNEIVENMLDLEEGQVTLRRTRG